MVGGVRGGGGGRGASGTGGSGRKDEKKPRGEREKCVYCKKVGHYAAKCPYLKCHECDKYGHKSMDCPNARCGWCGEEGHSNGLCPERTGATGKSGEALAELMVEGATSVVPAVSGNKRSYSSVAGQLTDELTGLAPRSRFVSETSEMVELEKRFDKGALEQRELLLQREEAELKRQIAQRQEVLREKRERLEADKKAADAGRDALALIRAGREALEKVLGAPIPKTRKVEGAGASTQAESCVPSHVKKMVVNIELLSNSTVPIVRHDEGEVKCSETVTSDRDNAAVPVSPCSNDELGTEGTVSDDPDGGADWEVQSRGLLLEDGEDGKENTLTDFGEQGREEDPSSPDK
jgi:hypothetical protein